MYQFKILLRILNHRYYSQMKHPAIRTYEALTGDIKSLFNGKRNPNSDYPEHTDCVIIGAGSLGVSIAYWLKARTVRGLDIVVLDRGMDGRGTKCTSFGGLHHHYSLPENIALSQYTAEFLRNIKEHLYRDFSVKFAPQGHLLLASDKYAVQLEASVALQKEHGVKTILLSPNRLKKTYPWINIDGIALGCLHMESDGWFDADSLKHAMKRKSEELGAQYIKAEVKNFVLQEQRDVLMEGVAPGTYKRLRKVVYEVDNGEEKELAFSICILAAGAESAELAKKAGIGVKDGMLIVPLPVASRKCNSYAFECDKLKLNTPTLMDISGTWLRRDGFTNTFICGQAPLSTFSWRDGDEDETYTKEAIHQSLIQRIPILENFKFDDHWTEKYDYTYYDESGIIGPHCYYDNLYFATGFGNCGMQHAPGIGRAITEIIIDGEFKSIDLTRFGFDRFMTGESFNSLFELCWWCTKQSSPLF